MGIPLDISLDEHVPDDRRELNTYSGSRRPDEGERESSPEGKRRSRLGNNPEHILSRAPGSRAVSRVRTSVMFGKFCTASI